jgi:hypothetical protein
MQVTHSGGQRVLGLIREKLNSRHIGDLNRNRFAKQSKNVPSRWKDGRLKKEHSRLGAVAHICNPSCLGGRDEKDYDSRLARPHLNL